MMSMSDEQEKKQFSRKIIVAVEAKIVSHETMFMHQSIASAEYKNSKIKCSVVLSVNGILCVSASGEKGDMSDSGEYITIGPQELVDMYVAAVKEGKVKAPAFYKLLTDK
jgi:hypothetical protein